MSSEAIQSGTSAVHEDLPAGTVLPNGQIVRYTYVERVCHWSTGFTYTYCMVTGLALFTPYLYWLATVLGGGATVRYWHPWVGVVFIALVIWMHQIWRGDMAFTNADREWTKKIKYYIANREDMVPPQDRFNAGQKQFYWVMFYGALALLLSGLVMWIPDRIPRSLHWILPLSVIVHEIAALVTIGAFIIHVYMGVLLVSGGLKGMVEGRVSQAWARHHHQLWYEKAIGKKVPK